MPELLPEYRFWWEDIDEDRTIAHDKDVYKVVFKTIRRKRGETENKQILFLQDVNTNENLIGEIDEDGELLFDDYETWTDDELKTIKDEILKIRRMLSWLC